MVADLLAVLLAHRTFGRFVQLKVAPQRWQWNSVHISDIVPSRSVYSGGSGCTLD